MSDFRRVGLIVGEASPTEFLFVADGAMPRWEYVLVNSVENVDGEEVDVNVIAQIDGIYSYSMALGQNLALDTAEKIIQAGLADSRVVAKARVLGFVYNDVVLQPRRSIKPGKEVYLAPEDELGKLYSYKEGGLFIGHLITRPTVPVSVSVKGFKRHLAVLAQTGAGKSYTTGVLLEELLRKGATIVVIDPHADYVFLPRKKDGSKIKRVEVFRTPESTGRYDESQVGKINTYEVKFSDLSVEEIAMVCGIRESWTNIMGVIQDAINNLQNSYTLDDFIAELESIGEEDQHALNALRYIRKLRRLRVFGSATTDIGKFLRPQHISVVDLSGLDDKVSDYVTHRILREIYDIAESEQSSYPVFVFIEEAHRFVPNKESTLSKGVIKRISAEGRKFGVFLGLITQRPYKIDSDALSQCNSQIIMRMTNPEDQNAVRRSSERMSESLLNDLPGLNVGEAVVVGEVTRAPVMLKVRERETREGGADIDVIDRLKQAVKVAEKEEEGRDETLKKEVERVKGVVEGYE